MTGSWLLPKVVELTVTYLVHSTLLLTTAWSLIYFWTSLNRSKKTSRYDFHPYLEERIWKTAAVLGLFTAPLSLLSDWSHSAWKLSFHMQPTGKISREIHDQDRVATRSLPTTPSDDLLVNLERIPLSQPEIEVDSSLAINSETIKPIELSGKEIFGSSPDLVPASSIEKKVTKYAGSKSGQITSVRFNPHLNGIQVVGAAILVWLGVSLIRFSMRTVQLHQILARCQPDHGPLLRELHQLSSYRRKIRLLRSEWTDPGANARFNHNSATGPFACGLFRWTIVLPDWIERELSPGELKALLAHEVAHLIRRDPFWQVFGEILCSSLAFQPLNFLARNRWQRATELICDDWAIEQQISSTSLANCLTRIAEFHLSRTTAQLGLTAVGDAGSLTHRIEWLLRSEREAVTKHRPQRLFATIFTLAAAILVGINGPHLSLTFSAETDAKRDEIAALNLIEADMTEIVNQLLAIESLLPDDAEATSLAEGLHKRAAALQKRLSQ